MDQKITQLTEDTTPASGDLLPIVDISGPTTKKITLSTIITFITNLFKVNSYILIGGTGSAGLSANTTYFFGLGGLGNNIQTSEGRCKTIIPFNGIINIAQVGYSQYGISGSGETSSVYIRINGTTDYLISNSFAQNESSGIVTSPNLNIPVSQGDYFEIKWLTPSSWATIPGNDGGIKMFNYVYLIPS